MTVKAVVKPCLTDLCEVVTVKAVVKPCLTDTVTVSITLALHGTVRSDVAKLTLTDVRRYTTTVLTALTADRLTCTPDSGTE